jgi:hypothetical protein
MTLCSATPPETNSTPPYPIVVNSTVPPLSNTNSPPLITAVSLAVPERVNDFDTAGVVI